MLTLRQKKYKLFKQIYSCEQTLKHQADLVSFILKVAYRAELFTGLCTVVFLFPECNNPVKSYR